MRSTLRMLGEYVGGCLGRGLRGSLGSALNWASIVGIAAVGTYLDFRGAKISNPQTWPEIVKWGAIYTAATWAIIFVLRLVFFAPFQLYAEAQRRVQALETEVTPVRLRQIEAQEAHSDALRRQAAAMERQNQENDPIVKMVRAKQEAQFLPRVIELIVGTDHEYYDIPKSGLYGFTRRYKIKLLNKNSHKTISNGKVQITMIEPAAGYRGPWLVAENITLSAGDHSYFPIASYGEVREQGKGNVADDAFQIECLSDHKPLLGIETEHYLTVRATASDVPFCEIRCKLWVDETGRFQIAKV